ncbi:MAG: hypothetical protein V4507_07675 [Verrucomicrobiota bacterium]
MKAPLSILSSGVVSAGGNSTDALLYPENWPQTPLPRLINNTLSTSVAPVDLSTLSRWKKEPRFRRSTPLSLFLMEATAQAIQPLSSLDQVGLIVVTFTGSITYSRRFYQEIVEGGARAASPMMFPETVFNSPASHIAAQLQLGGPIYSLMGDESAWIAGLETASLWIQLKQARSVVVVAGYEIDAMSIEAYHAAGWIRKGLISTEGAGALLVGESTATSNAKIDYLDQGYLYRTREEFRKEKQRLEKKMEGREILQAPWNPWTITTKTPSTPHCFGVSAAWKTILQAKSLSKTPSALPIYGCNHQAGWIGMSYSS